MNTLVERLREEADDTHKNWYRVASDEQREICRSLTLEAADRIAALEGALRDVNMICAQAPAFEDMDETMYDQVIEAIQQRARKPFALETSEKQS